LKVNSFPLWFFPEVPIAPSCQRHFFLFTVFPKPLMADTQSLYMQLRERARQIVARFPAVDFYRDEAGALEVSRTLFKTAPLVVGLRRDVTPRLQDDFGHGMLHASRVALDAGALTHIEGEAAGYRGGYLQRRICIVHCASLLHDIERKQSNHAEQGASLAAELLARHPLGADEKEDICIAIRNHEAFKPTVSANTPEGALVSDCLYDADKFRWGPDNFTDTLWAMVAFRQPTLREFVGRYPAGMKSLVRIKDTFRTPTGRTYGPGFIDLGIAVGEELYRIITTEYAAYL
jgi:hypothetical protein